MWVLAFYMAIAAFIVPNKVAKKIISILAMVISAVSVCDILLHLWIIVFQLITEHRYYGRGYNYYRFSSFFYYGEKLNPLSWILMINWKRDGNWAEIFYKLQQIVVNIVMFCIALLGCNQSVYSKAEDGRLYLDFKQVFPQKWRDSWKENAARRKAQKAEEEKAAKVAAEKAEAEREAAEKRAAEERALAETAAIEKEEVAVSETVKPAQEPVYSSEKMNFCPNCGSPVQGTEKFCSNCGASLVKEENKKTVKVNGKELEVSPKSRIAITILGWLGLELPFFLPAFYSGAVVAAIVLNIFFWGGAGTLCAVGYTLGENGYPVAGLILMICGYVLVGCCWLLQLIMAINATCGKYVDKQGRVISAWVHKN